MFTRIISRSNHWLTALFEEPDVGSKDADGIRDTILLVAAGLGLAAILVTLTTLTALGLDALLHASFSFNGDL